MRDVVETLRQNVSTRGAGAISIALLFSLTLLLASCGGGEDSPGPVPLVTDPAGFSRITFVNQSGDEIDLLVEIADDAQERSRGLMSRQSLPEDQGMLFVFEQEGNHNFWMKDTIIPLSIAFIDGAGDVIEIHDREPLDETLRTAAEPSLYVIEVNQGWLERNGIVMGSTVNIEGTTPGPSPSPSPQQS